MGPNQTHEGTYTLPFRRRQRRTSHHRQMVDNTEPTSFEDIYRCLRSHHRQMVGNPEPTSTEKIHRIAAVAT